MKGGWPGWGLSAKTEKVRRDLKKRRRIENMDTDWHQKVHGIRKANGLLKYGCLMFNFKWGCICVRSHVCVLY